MADADLSKLATADGPSVIKALEKRFGGKEIYTRNGSVLIAINPYSSVDSLYTQAEVEKYKASMALDQEKPHIFAIASAAHRNMISAKKNQAVVISGESGAGKTESARFVLQYLRFVSNATDALEKRIDGSQPITEAFGCAKTLRNDNSSRFGKFLMLHFNQSAKIQARRPATRTPRRTPRRAAPAPAVGVALAPPPPAPPPSLSSTGPASRLAASPRPPPGRASPAAPRSPLSHTRASGPRHPDPRPHLPHPPTPTPASPRRRRRRRHRHHHRHRRRRHHREPRSRRICSKSRASRTSARASAPTTSSTRCCGGCRRRRASRSSS